MSGAPAFISQLLDMALSFLCFPVRDVFPGPLVSQMPQAIDKYLLSHKAKGGTVLYTRGGSAAPLLVNKQTLFSLQQRDP